MNCKGFVYETMLSFFDNSFHSNFNPIPWFALPPL